MLQSVPTKTPAQSYAMTDILPTEDERKDKGVCVHICLDDYVIM